MWNICGIFSLSSYVYLNCLFYDFSASGALKSQRRGGAGRGGGAGGGTSSRKGGSVAAQARKAAVAKKMAKMTKAEKEKYKKGKRDPDSDGSEFSYRSYVSDGGTRHVARKRKRGDGTYSAEQSYHSSQDEDGDARRRRRRREREHGSDSDHSYYSVVSAGGTRTVRRRKRHEDGTYSRSESYHSGHNDQDFPGGGDNGRDATDGSFYYDEDGNKIKKKKGKKGGSDDDNSDDEEDEYEDSDISVYSETSEGGTRRTMQKKRIRDADGNIIGYGEAETAKIKKKKGGSNAGRCSEREAKEALESLRNKRNGELLREMTTDSLRDLREDGENIVGNNMQWPGSEAGGNEQMVIDDVLKCPSDFSDATTDDDDVDLSKLTPAQRRQYLAEKEKRRKERERRRREKYGDKYDDIMKKKNAKKYEQFAQLKAEREAEEQARKEEREKELLKDKLSRGRRSSNASNASRGGGRPKSMVTYDKGPPRDLLQGDKLDKREIGMAHDDWGPKERRGRKGSDASDVSDAPPKLHRETTMIKPLPTIPQGRLYEDDKGSKTNRSYKVYDTDDDSYEFTKPGETADKSGIEEKEKLQQMFEVGEDGKIRLRGKKIDLSRITADELRALGIDPNMSAKEIAIKLKELFGNDVQIIQDGIVIGTKPYGDLKDLSESALADEMDLDLDTLSGLKRVNVIMRRGGEVLKQHVEKVISLSKLVDKYAKDLDERADIDFLSHYRLVDPGKIDSYARAFVVEDTDLDTVINRNEARVALDGVPSIQHITNKQMDYVLKVLRIDEATLITFRMFAVVTALCERVTHMDTLSQKLLEICNLADIERKLDLYKAMFYHNVESDRDSNFITNESLRIELIAGGLNLKQQGYIMEKMEPNDLGEISFLDYMCYIPLFLSMHDNICYNPLDMSNQKYQQPPRERPVSVQRDMNPLGSNLSKKSAHWVRKRAMEMMSGTPNNAVQVSKSYMDILNRYKSERYTRLQKVEDQRTSDMQLKENTSSSLGSKGDMIY